MPKWPAVVYSGYIREAPIYYSCTMILRKRQCSVMKWLKFVFLKGLWLNRSSCKGMLTDGGYQEACFSWLHFVTFIFHWRFFYCFHTIKTIERKVFECVTEMNCRDSKLENSAISSDHSANCASILHLGLTPNVSWKLRWFAVADDPGSNPGRQKFFSIRKIKKVGRGK